MSFAENYIIKNDSRFLVEAPYLPASVKMVVVIPCFNEPELSIVLDSLFKTEKPEIDVAVVVVVNSSDTSNPEIISQNEHTITELSQYKLTDNEWLSLYWVCADKLPNKWAGAGWARKIGMDWAITHFNRVGNEDGIIVSLDADSLVEKNYLRSIDDFFRNNPKKIAATIYFEHSINSATLNEKQTEAIILYELYMRYYKNALAVSGFQGSIYTVGSCFAVKAKAYVAQGGMNRRKAGEDFYFLHKILQYGEIGEIKATCVYPSSRISNRVPFGTGPAIANYLKGNTDLTVSYPFAAFQVLEGFFSKIDLFFLNRDLLDLTSLHTDKTFLEFASQSALHLELKQLASNCSTVQSFRKRFFHLFDAFQVLKWLNFASTKNYPKCDLLIEVEKLLLKNENNSSKLSLDKFLLLLKLRSVDRC